MIAYRTAVLLLREHGADAVPIAEAHAHALIEAAQIGDAVTWVQIVSALRDFMRGPDADTTIH